MPNGNPLTDDDKLRIIDMIEAGEKPEVVAKKMGLGRSTIYRVRSEFQGKDVRSMETVIAGDKTNGLLVCTGPNHYVGSCAVRGGKMKKRHFSVQGSDNAKKQWEAWKASLHDASENRNVQEVTVSATNNNKKTTTISLPPNTIYILAVGDPKIAGWFENPEEARDAMKAANKALEFAGVDIRYSVLAIRHFDE